VDDDEGLNPAARLDHAPAESFGQRMDRRNVMKKAAVGAGAVWVAPKISGLSRRPGFARSLSPCSGTFHFNALLAGTVNDSSTADNSPIGMTERHTFQACGPFHVAIRQDYQRGIDAFSVMAVNVVWTSDTCVVNSLNVDGKRHELNAPVQSGPTNKQTVIKFSNKATDGDPLGLDNRPSGGGVVHLEVTCT
jgi:hypothetical protein